MLLRSSSTPVLGSLLPSFSDSPNKDFDTNNKKPLSISDHHLKKISFFHGGQPNFSSFSCNSSPITQSISGFSDLDRESSSISSTGFRRARSDGNLEGLIEEFHNSKPLRSYRKPNSSMLQTIPSFSIYNSNDGCEEEDDYDDEEEEEDGLLQSSVTIGKNIMELSGGGGGSGGFSFGKNMGLIEEESSNLGVQEEGRPRSPPLFLARGLGIDEGFGGGGDGGNGGGDFIRGEFNEGGRDGSNMEEHYKKLVEQNPSNPLFLRNYAQFLYESKGDLQGAEEYYSRAVLEGPGDGEILSQYAKIVWELHHDHELASNYFERAVQFAPEDSHVLAAYASFLWETEDEEEESPPQEPVNMPVFHGAMTSASS